MIDKGGLNKEDWLQLYEDPKEQTKARMRAILNCPETDEPVAGAMTVEEAADATGKSESYIQGVLRRLCKKGVMGRIWDGRRFHYYFLDEQESG
jgi:predicted transcriptional regulator of viral defense system